MDVRKLVTISFLCGLLGLPAGAGGIAILEPLVSDNGDGDGFPDTRETVTIRLRLQNTTPDVLNGVELRLSTQDHALACVTQSIVAVGTLFPGQILDTAQGFELVMTDVDRATLGLGPYEDLSLQLDLAATAAAPAEAPPVYPWRMRLDLDLDAAGGSGPTTFLESFENGLGHFAVDNMDAGLYDLATSDGYRCQYHDPDWINSMTYGIPEFADECYLNVSPLHADAIWWGLSGPGISPENGRGFTGFHSLFYGIDMGPPLNWTTPMGTLEAAITPQPIPLRWDVAPTLSFKHMINLIDGRASDLIDEGREPTETGAGGGPDATDPLEAFDRAVILAQVADEQGKPVGVWHKLDPAINVYDQPGTDNFAGNCMFDPIDDGSTEDSFYDPLDPERVYGPSSTCYPEAAWASMGETDELFNPENVGNADGPPLQGIWGIGTWVESKFDLSRFRGRSIRLRFLVSAMQILPNDDWEEYLAWNPNPGDNGWWIDDVTVDGALTTPASMAPDLHDNSALPGLPPSADPDSDLVCSASDNCPSLDNPGQEDGDVDGAGTACDCDDAAASVYPGAAEINDGLDNQCPGDAGHGIADEITGTTGFFDPINHNAYSWPPQEGAIRYQVVRATSPDFLEGCFAFPLVTVPVLTDIAPVGPGVVHYYLVRPTYPHVGSWGLNSAGQVRTVPCAP
jgi:hypothetical protein